jgi:hypothetical protein
MGKRWEVRATLPGSLGFKREFWTEGEAVSAFECLRDFLVIYWPCVDTTGSMGKLSGLPCADLTKITPGEGAVPVFLEVVDNERPSRR